MLCVATQVIEAGVDISFNAVMRLAAGMDSIVQAAGRCNRSGESAVPRPVYTVFCSDERLDMLRDILLGKEAALALMTAFQKTPERFEDDLLSDAAICYYYRALYQEMADQAQDYSLAKEDTTLFDLMATNEKYADEHCPNAEGFFLHQAFKTAGAQFTVFDEDTTDILVPYGRGKQLIAKLCGDRCRHDPLYRAAVLKEASSYTVGIYPNQKERLEQRQALISVCGGCAWVLGDGFYDDAVGLTVSEEKQEYTEV